MHLDDDMKIRIDKVRKSAKGEGCTLRLPGCDGGGVSGTTVWAHSPYIEDGKGRSTKADDIFGCYACHSCHDILDGRKKATVQDLRDRFHRAMKESWRRLILRGVLK